MTQNRFLLQWAIAIIAVVSLSGCWRGNGSGEDVDYLAVKIAGQNNWSIIDVNSGEFVYENEFKHKPSMIVDDCFFLKTDNEKGYECFNVDDISNPINSAHYVAATNFHDGVAIVKRKNGPLSIINTDGEVVKELDKNIISAKSFENGFAMIKNDDGKYGFVNTRGEVVVKPRYDMASSYSSDGYAVVETRQDGSTSTFTILDDKGQKMLLFSS